MFAVYNFSISNFQFFSLRKVWLLSKPLLRKILFCHQKTLHSEWKFFIPKTMDIAGELRKIITNIERPPISKILVLSEVFHSVLLYVVSVWNEMALSHTLQSWKLSKHLRSYQFRQYPLRHYKCLHIFWQYTSRLKSEPGFSTDENAHVQQNVKEHEKLTWSIVQKEYY